MVPRTPSRLLAAAACAAGFLVPSAAQAAGDRYRSEQWGLEAVAAPEAWQQSTGEGVIVAVIDSGVQVDHPDLAANIWTNPGETANGLDDDGNGIVDDIHGADMVTKTGDVSDEDGHGTHIAGIIAAEAGNGIGVAGLAPQAQIMPIKVYGEGATAAGVANGIHYAVDNGARILNLSMAGDVNAPLIADAVAYASAQGATIVAAAGNNARDIDAEPIYPASLPDPGVLTVTATNEDGSVEENFGAHTVELAAPGEYIASTINGSEYEVRGGSSMAAPFAAGALALLAAARPDLSQAELRAALLSSAKASPLLEGKVSAGGLDVGAAMHQLVEGDWGIEPVSMRVQAQRKARLGRPAKLRWSVSDPERVASWRVTLAKCRSQRVSGDGRRVAFRTVRRGLMKWIVTGYDADGVKVVSATASTRVTW